MSSRSCMNLMDTEQQQTITVRIILNIFTTMSSTDIHTVVPFGAVNPSDGQIFQDDHYSERQSSRVIIKHGDKVVP